MKDLTNPTKPTWCPGCFNFQILAGVKKAIPENTAIVSGIGCHAKIFDYLNSPGINTLHGKSFTDVFRIEDWRSQLAGHWLLR